MKTIYPKRFSRADEVAQWIRRLAIGTDLSLIPRTHVLEGENWLLKVVLTSTYMSWHMTAYIHTSKYVHIERSGFASRPSRVHLKKRTVEEKMLRAAREEGWVTMEAGRPSCSFSVDRLWAQNFTPNQSICFTLYSVPVIKCSAKINKGQRVYSAAYSQGTVHHRVEARNLKLEAGGHNMATARKQRVKTSRRCSAPSHHWHSTRCHAGSQGSHSGLGLLTWMNDIKTSLPQHTQGSIF